jgi:outer membrane lipoprotein-sorting protein
MSTRRYAAWGLALSAAAATFASGPAAAQALTAAQIVERNAAARGGREAWRKVETMTWTGHVEGANRGPRVPFVLAQKRPDRTRFEITVEGQKSIRVFDGSSGWKLGAGSTGRPELRPYTAEELQFARGAPVIDGPLMDYAARGASISSLGLQELDGHKAYLLAMRLASGSSYRVWIDAATFLELRYDRELLDAQGRPMVASAHFTDYRTVEGLRLPFVMETGTAGGQARDRLVIEQVSLNPRLDDRAFAKPGAMLGRARGAGAIVDARGAAQGGATHPAR